MCWRLAQPLRRLDRIPLEHRAADTRCEPRVDARASEVQMRPRCDRLQLLLAPSRERNGRADDARIGLELLDRTRKRLVRRPRAQIGDARTPCAQCKPEADEREIVLLVRCARENDMRRTAAAPAAR